MPETQKITVRQYFQTQTLIHVALVAGMALFGAVTVYLRLSLPAGGGGADAVFRYLVPLVAVAGVAAAFLVFRLMLAKARAQPDLKAKVSRYGAALLVRYALLEAPALLAIIAFFLTGQWLYLAVAAGVLLLFATLRPTQARLEQELELGPAETAYLADPEAVITQR